MEDLFELFNKLPRRAGIIFTVLAVAILWWVGSKVGRALGWIKEEPPAVLGPNGKKTPRCRIPLR
jgi:hypothetical protein